MITFKKSLAYGVDKNINRDLLIINKFKISGDEKDIRKLLDNLSKFGKKLYQYNIKDRKADYDYFFWCNVENDTEDYSYITLEYNRNHSVVNIISEMVWLLWWIKGFTKKLTFEVNVEYNDVHNLIKDIDERIEFDNMLDKKER